MATPKSPKAQATKTAAEAAQKVAQPITGGNACAPLPTSVTSSLIPHVNECSTLDSNESLLLGR